MKNHRLPNSAALTDDDRSTSTFPVMGVPTGADIVGDLVARSGHPEDTMGSRSGSDGLCSVCGLHPSQPVQAAHPYVPMIGRTPGVSQDVDWDRTQNDPDDVGQDQMDVSSDPEISSGRAEQRFRAASSRQIPFRHGEGPFPA
jgi:hypothetical protein